MPCFVFSVSAKWAEPIDYTDLDYKVKYGTEYNTVTVQLPADNYLFKLGDQTNGLEILDYGVEAFTFYGEINHKYYIRVYPASSFGLDLEHIPAGSVLRFELSITEHDTDENGYVYYNHPDVRMVTHYLGYNGSTYEWLNGKNHDRIQDTTFSGTYTFECTTEDVDGAIGFVPRIQFDNFYPAGRYSNYTIRLINATLEMKISTDYWQQWQNEQNGEMLNSLNDKLDSALNGDINAQAPSDKGSFDDLKQSEDALMDNVQNYLDDGIGFFDNAVGSIMGVADGFRAIKALTAPVFNLPFANDIILVSVSLGLIGTLIGLASHASSSLSKKSKSEMKEKAFKDGYKAGFVKKNDI